METIRIPPFEDLERLFALIMDEQPALLPACRWLVLGPRLARLVLPEAGEPPARKNRERMRRGRR